MNVDAYLQRISYSGSREPTIGTLSALHQAHLLTVPFENLDVVRGARIVLDERRLFEKLVRGRRGGFCYELNGLFAALLRSLGFDVTLLSARVVSDDRVGPEFDHLTLVVGLEERWLADVGFGESFFEPLRLDEREEQTSAGHDYRIRVGPGGDYWVERRGADWESQYVFNLEPRALGDFDEMCHYQQTSPDSHFTHGRTCSLATLDGRVTLRDNRLIVTRGGEREERVLERPEELEAVLQERFGLSGDLLE